MSSVTMWRGCRRLWWAHSPPARFPRPPPADARGGPVGSCGRRAYAPPAGEGAQGRLQGRLGRGILPWGLRGHPGQGWDRHGLAGIAEQCRGYPPVPLIIFLLPCLAVNVWGGQGSLAARPSPRRTSSLHLFLLGFRDFEGMGLR